MIIDLLACLLLAFGIYQGYASGLIKTVFATVSIIVALVAALKLSPIVIHLLQRNLDFNPAVLFVIGFVLTFILVLILVRFVGTKLEGVMKSLQINIVNKAAGAALLGLFYAILFSYGLYFVDRMSLVSEKQKSASFSYPILRTLPAVTTSVGKKLQPVFSGFWEAFMDTMDDIRDKGQENLVEPD